MEILFWFAVALIFYTYAGYPIWLLLMPRVQKRPSSGQLSNLQVSVIIAAHNEEVNIVRRVANLNEQSYPKESLEIIVVSDGSSDNTVAALKRIEGANLKVIELTQNRGKAVALNTGVAHSSADIIVFTDARQTFASNAIERLVSNFAALDVGVVCGELCFVTDGKSMVQAEMGAYWKYEKWIRKAESDVGSVVGATGAIYAIRRKLYSPLPEGTILDDVLTPLKIVMKGFRCIFDNSALAHDVVSTSVSQEWKRKLRTLAGNWQLLSLCPPLLNPVKNPVWWRFFSHKILRLVMPFLLLFILGSSMLLDATSFRLLFACQLAIYGLALAAHMIPSLRNLRIANITYFVVAMNAAALVGFWLWVSGACARAWQPAYKAGGAK